MIVNQSFFNLVDVLLRRHVGRLIGELRYDNIEW